MIPPVAFAVDRFRYASGAEGSDAARDAVTVAGPYLTSRTRRTCRGRGPTVATVGAIIITRSAAGSPKDQ